MKQIQAEGTTYIYLTKAEGLPPASVKGSKVEGIPDQQIWNNLLKTSMDDMRLVLSTYPRTNTTYLYYLHWDDGTDLDELDKKVLEDTCTDEDFVNSVKTQLVRTKCFNCNWEGYTLVMPPAEFYIGAPELGEKKMAARYARKGFKSCPNCGTRLQQDVVKIFTPESK